MAIFRMIPTPIIPAKATPAAAASHLASGESWEIPNRQAKKSNNPRMRQGK